MISIVYPLLALSSKWQMFGLLGLGYVVISIRVALAMRKMGRSFWRWLPLCLCLTALPALAVIIWAQFGWLFRGEPDPRHTQREDPSA